MKFFFLLFLLLNIWLSQVWGGNGNFSSNPIKPAGTYLIFVSFSMPKQSLEAYLRDAKKIHASLVIRGLVDHSFQKTFQEIATLVKASGGDGMELNPLLFKRFGIEKVPTIIVVPEDSTCMTHPSKKDEKALSFICDKSSFDQISGDISLAAALREIRDRGGLTKDMAQAALRILEEPAHYV